MTCVGLGAVGVVVPGLPTTVFLIAASYLFAKSSPEMHRRLLEHKQLGPYLTRFAEERAMPARAKVTALAMMWTGIGVSSALAGFQWVLLVALLAAGLTGTAVILFYVRTAAPLASA